MIVRRAGVRAGAPTIAGTGIRVTDVAVRYEALGMSADEIVTALPHLTLAQVHAALAYYYQHKADLDHALARTTRAVARLRSRHMSPAPRARASHRVLPG